MRIVADAQLADVEALFSPYGELRLLPAPEITAAAVSDCDALLLRSVTRVDAGLIADSNLHFVGTATSGRDHVDQQLLHERGIAFAAAPGSNADAVADYCLTVLLTEFDSSELSSLRVGLVGYGHIGSVLGARLQRLGIALRICDPPLAEQGVAATQGLQPSDFLALEELADCDVLSLHVPLTETGVHATHGLIGRAMLEALPPRALLLNTCRGEVVVEEALLSRLEGAEGLRYAGDVWAGEPEVNARLVAASSLATPHFAGYSRRAKARASRQIQQAFLAHFGLASEAPTEAEGRLELEAVDSLQYLLARVLPLAHLSRRFKTLVAAGQSREAFRGLRQQMLKRYEFSQVRLPDSRLSEAESELARAMGFITGD